MSKTLGVWEGTVGGWVDTVDCSYDMIDGLLNGLCNWLYYRGVGSRGAMGVRPPNNKVGGPGPPIFTTDTFFNVPDKPKGV